MNASHLFPIFICKTYISEWTETFLPHYLTNMKKCLALIKIIKIFSLRSFIYDRIYSKSKLI